MSQPEGTTWSGKDWAPFRTCFPIRYFISDFELAVTFDLDSDPSSRVVRELPTVGVRPGQYGRDCGTGDAVGQPVLPISRRRLAAG